MKQKQSAQWKEVERSAADFLNPGVGKRTPLSGSNSGHGTTGDAIGVGNFYLEVKHRKVHTACTLHRKTRDAAKKEGRIPVTILHELGRHGFQVMIDSRDAIEFCKEFLKNNNYEVVEPCS